MRKIIILGIASVSLLMAETTSMDITITDLKEATYKLINDVRALKKGQRNSASSRLKRVISDIEKKQKKAVYIKEGEDANDRFIRSFVSRNSSSLVK